MSLERTPDLEERAGEIAAFLQLPVEHCIAELQKGFIHHHHAVSDDWRKVNPQTDAEILEWYRTTVSYIWELSAYHLDPGFNYMQMIGGIWQSLEAKGVNRVLCLGDGVGDLTILLRRRGFAGVYHDLQGSRTAAFADARQTKHLGHPHAHCFSEPEHMLVPNLYDAVVTLDFLEHVFSVEDWVRAVHASLKPRGWLCSQNAFNMGSGPEGGMPMHLACNDRYERDWDPLLIKVGFEQFASNWYRKL